MEVKNILGPNQSRVVNIIFCYAIFHYLRVQTLNWEDKSMCTALWEAHGIVVLLQWKIGFKSQSFYLKSQRLQVFFGCSKKAQGSLGLPVLASEGFLSGPQVLFRGLFGPFLPPATHSHSELHTWNSKKNDGKWIVMFKNIMATHGPLIFIISIFWLIHLDRLNWT